jgi:glyceraldehyde-3-phosphate dehydrogenase/erythrose-4-phosphate dehydrogenase
MLKYDSVHGRFKGEIAVDGTRWSSTASASA